MRKMMQINKKSLIGIISAVVLILIVVLVFNKSKKINNETDDISEAKTKDEVLYDEETGLYYLKNDETDEIMYASRNKEELQVYVDNPDYNPNPLAPKKTTLEEYMYMEEYFESVPEE